jgi:hypothetical protein
MLSKLLNYICSVTKPSRLRQGKGRRRRGGVAASKEGGVAVSKEGRRCRVEGALVFDAREGSRRRVDSRLMRGRGGVAASEEPPPSRVWCEGGGCEGGGRR